MIAALIRFLGRRVAHTRRDADHRSARACGGEHRARRRVRPRHGRSPKSAAGGRVGEDGDRKVAHGRAAHLWQRGTRMGRMQKI